MLTAEKIKIVEKIKLLVTDGVLTATKIFMDMDNTHIAEEVNGCGSELAKFDFVPDTIYGLKISMACFIHDIDYIVGETIKDKQDADFRFLMNLLALVNIQKGLINWALKPLRRRRALLYYEAVTEFGHSSFWLNKVR